MSKKASGLASWFADIRADYEMTRQSRFIRRRTGVAPLGSSADYHFRTETEYYNAIEQARDMDRNDGLVGTLADRRVDNIVQQGFTLDTKTGDKALDQDLWHRWQAFANDPERVDIAGELCFHEMERFACRAESIDGDIVVIGTEDGPLQMLEAHNIATSSKVADTFCGVTRDQYGRRLQYHVRYDVNEYGQKSDSAPIDVRNDDGVRQLFHIYNPKRVSMTRGVTQLAPVFALSGMLEDINFAKLVQQQIVSCFAIFRKLAAGSDDLPSVDGAAKYGEPSSEQTATGSRQLEGISPGMEIVGRAGEELSGFSPNVPNSEYFQQVKLILQIIGVNFGLPLCLVLMDGSETNFSGWRGAVDEARKGFVADQENLVRRFHDPVYRWWLYREIEQDKALAKMLKTPGIDIFGHKWNLPTWSYIEPVADADGDVKQLQSALTSPRRMHAARGKDWETIADEIVEDNRYAIEKAQTQANEINARFPGGPQLSWRDLIPLPMPAGQTLALQDPNAIAAQQKSAETEQTDTPPEPASPPTAKSKRKPKAADQGEWRTTQDGGKIFIGPGGDPKFAGPDGPPVKKDGGGGQPKREDRRFPGRPDVGAVVDKRPTKIGMAKVVVVKSEDKEVDYGGKFGTVVDDAVQFEVRIGTKKIKTTKVGTQAEAEREADKIMKKAVENAEKTGQPLTTKTVSHAGKDVQIQIVHDGYGGFHGHLKTSRADGQPVWTTDGSYQFREPDRVAVPREGEFTSEKKAAAVMEQRAQKFAEKISKADQAEKERNEREQQSETQQPEESEVDRDQRHESEQDDLATKHDEELRKALDDDVDDDVMQKLSERHDAEMSELKRKHQAEVDGDA